MAQAAESGTPGAVDLDRLPALAERPRNVTLETVAASPYDPTKDRERVGGWIAIGLSLLVAALVMVSLLSVLAGWMPVDDLGKIANVLISPLLGLLGAVVGFYYGEQSRGSD